MKTKSERPPIGGADAGARKMHSAWPLDVMVTAASMVVDRKLVTKRVAEELRIPYTTLSEWVKRYRAGGRAALESAPGRGGKRAGNGAGADARRRAPLPNA